jgi:hypothetical protein
MEYYKPGGPEDDRVARARHGRRSGSDEKWTRGDLNPRPLLCESSDLPLIYVPWEVGMDGPP